MYRPSDDGEETHQLQGAEEPWPIGFMRIFEKGDPVPFFDDLEEIWERVREEPN